MIKYMKSTDMSLCLECYKNYGSKVTWKNLESYRAKVMIKNRFLLRKNKDNSLVF